MTGQQFIRIVFEFQRRPCGCSTIYDDENRLIQVYVDVDSSGGYNGGDRNIAEFTYDALGRRIEMVDAAAPATTRYYYDDQRVLLETDFDSGTQTETDLRYFVYGNYIDEVLTIHDSLTTNDYFYAHDHLYSPVAIYAQAGLLLERYEYDAYGKATIMTPLYVERTSSLMSNPYTFTGRRLDAMDWNGSQYQLNLMYYRARTYDPQTGRFMQRDPLGIDPAGGTQNPFGVQYQYFEGCGLQVYAKNEPINHTDPLGLECSCGDLAEWHTRGAPWPWNFIDARLHFIMGSGRTVEFQAGSPFSDYVENNLRGPWKERVPTELEFKVAPLSQYVAPNSCMRLGIPEFPVTNYHYYDNGDWNLAGTIGSGNDDEYSDILLKADCCLEKDCCISGGITHVKYKCKVEVTIRDLYGYHYFPDEAKKGTNFWTVVHFFKDYSGEFTVGCDKTVIAKNN